MCAISATKMRHVQENTRKTIRSTGSPSLPKFRVNEESPFTMAGVDYTLALCIRNNGGTACKAYVCLFTCTSTRAVNLEIVPDFSEESFLQAFRRFCSRKSVPRTMVSDNATTFMAMLYHLSCLVAYSSI